MMSSIELHKTNYRWYNNSTRKVCVKKIYSYFFPLMLSSVQKKNQHLHKQFRHCWWHLAWWHWQMMPGRGVVTTVARLAAGRGWSLARPDEERPGAAPSSLMWPAQTIHHLSSPMWFQRINKIHVHQCQAQIDPYPYLTLINSLQL